MLSRSLPNIIENLVYAAHSSMCQRCLQSNRPGSSCTNGASIKMGEDDNKHLESNLCDVAYKTGQVIMR